MTLAGNCNVSEEAGGVFDSRVPYTCRGLAGIADSAFLALIGISKFRVFSGLILFDPITSLSLKSEARKGAAKLLLNPLLKRWPVSR